MTSNTGYHIYSKNLAILSYLVIRSGCEIAYVIDVGVWMGVQFSRVPVFSERVDNIVGVMYCYDMLIIKDTPGRMVEMTVSDICQKPPYFIPETMSVWNLLREFRIRKSHMAGNHHPTHTHNFSRKTLSAENMINSFYSPFYRKQNRRKSEICLKHPYLFYATYVRRLKNVENHWFANSAI